MLVEVWHAEWLEGASAEEKQWLCKLCCSAMVVMVQPPSESESEWGEREGARFSK